MTIKQKFERIDQSKLEQKQVDALKIVSDFTENFKTTDKEKIRVTNEKLDAIIGKLQEKNPDAVKPIPSSKSAQKPKPSKKTVYSVAKDIKKAGESFDDAKKRASAQMKDDKKQASAIVHSELKKLMAYIRQHKKLRGITGTDLQRDSKRVAKIGGRRISKNGKVYYENRENRKDRLAPKYPKHAPLLESGGATGDYDLAGQLGGDFNVGQNDGDLSGTTGTLYEGLTGETGAMSAGEMFKKGGSIDHRYLNRSQDYEVRYAKGKNRHGYGNVKYEKGGKTVDFSVFEKIVKESKSEEDAFNKAREVKDVPASVSKAFREKYDPKNELTPRTSFSKFYKEVKAKPRTRKEYLEEIGLQEAGVWDEIGAESGGDIRTNKALLKKYAEGVEKVMRKNDIGHGSFDQSDYDFFTDENWHLFNDFLVWNNYYEPELTVKEKKWRQKSFDEKSVYVSDPSVITVAEKKGWVRVVKTANRNYIVELQTNAGNWKQFNDTWSLDELEKAEKFAKRISENHKVRYEGVDTTPYNFVHGKSKKYVPHYEIKEVTVKKGDKEVTYKGSDVLNGANLLKKGGNISELAMYYSKAKIVSVTLKDGSKIKPSNGYWITKKNPKMARTQFEDSVYEYDKGGDVEDAVEEVIINKDGIRVKSATMPDKKMTYAEWLSKHNESVEAVAYKKGGELENYSEFIQQEFPRAKRDANKYAKKYDCEYLVYVEKEDSDKIGITIASSFSKYPKSYQDAHEILYSTSKKRVLAEGGKATFAEKSNAIARNFEGKKVEPKYQKEYGKAYSRAEAKEVGNKIAGSQKAKYDAKAEKGIVVGKKAGSSNMAKAVSFAKANRKQGESWTSALKRGWDSLK